MAVSACKTFKVITGKHWEPLAALLCKRYYKSMFRHSKLVLWHAPFLCPCLEKATAVCAVCSVWLVLSVISMCRSITTGNWSIGVSWTNSHIVCSCSGNFLVVINLLIWSTKCRLVNTHMLKCQTDLQKISILYDDHQNYVKATWLMFWGLSPYRTSISV